LWVKSTWLRLLIGLLGQGHILLEGVPGLAKNFGYKYTFKVHGSFSRIQFTPLPADVVGTMIYNIKQNEFSIKRPIFAFRTADEINRAPAKVQSLACEAMQKKVTL
jgi:MoxR-like ATPase